MCVSEGSRDNLNPNSKIYVSFISVSYSVFHLSY